MTPKIITLNENAANLPPGGMTAYSTEREAMAAAIERGQPFVYVLAHQDTWLVAK